MSAVSLDSIPRFSAAEARAVLEREYGFAGEVSPLPSERDQNFLVRGADGGKSVFKIANRDDACEILDFQHVAMRRVANFANDCKVQAVIPTRSGADLTSIEDPSRGFTHCVRMFSFLEGGVLAKHQPRTAALHASIGAAMASVDLALSEVSHPAMHRTLQWDLRHAGLARAHAHLLSPSRRGRIESLFADWSKIDWSLLRHGVIHGDANDYNVLVAGDRMSGLLDFGDMVHSAVVCDLAIAIAYTMLEEPDPIAAASGIAAAYHRVNPLTEAERHALYPLILSRLSMSVCYSAQNRARNPDDPYQVVSEAPAWKLLDALQSRPDAAFALFNSTSYSR
jgi:Ser/Thr protein kinase RdoA (MazF antagonist)